MGAVPAPGSNLIAAPQLESHSTFCPDPVRACRHARLDGKFLRTPMPYTHGHHESVLRSHKWRTVDNSAAYLAPHLTSGIHLADLGCGPGTITADIGRR